MMGWHQQQLESRAETDSSHLQVQASNMLHICACAAVNARDHGLVNIGEDTEASSATFLSCSVSMCLKSNAQLGLKTSESESANHHL